MGIKESTLQGFIWTTVNAKVIIEVYECVMDLKL